MGAACGISDRDGGAGYVWSASFDEKGVGHLRFLAVDVSALPATQTKVATSSGLQENNAAPSKEPEQEQASPEQEESLSSGSGFAVSNDGLILTNRHVVENCKGISVADFGSAIIKAVDEQNDLALLKIQGTTSAAKFRPSAVGLGETVYVLGFPLGGILGAGMNFTSGRLVRYQALEMILVIFSSPHPFNPATLAVSLIGRDRKLQSRHRQRATLVKSI